MSNIPRSLFSQEPHYRRQIHGPPESSFKAQTGTPGRFFHRPLQLVYRHLAHVDNPASIASLRFLSPIALWRYRVHEAGGNQRVVDALTGGQGCLPSAHIGVGF
jgi:hypothetical protein